MKKTITKLTFVLVTVVLTATSALAHFGSKGPYVGGTVTSYVVNKDTIYVGTANGGVYAATWTKGAVVANDSILSNWSAKPVGLKSGKIVSLAHTGKYAIAATADSGIFRFSGYVGSDRYWVKINQGLTDLNITSVIALDANTLLAGTSTGKIFKSTDLGTNWTEVTGLAFVGKKVAGIELAGSRVFVLAEGKGVYYSENQGSNWTAINDVNTENIPGKASFSYNKSTDELMVANTSGVFKLSTAKSSTTANYSKVIAPTNANINSISNNGDFWYIATNKGVQVSSSNQIFWMEMNDGLPADVNVNVVTLFKKSGIAGTDNSGIFKIVGNVPYVWGDANTGFNNMKTNSFATNNAKLIYVANERGVYVTKNLATSYTKINKGLTDSLHVNDLVIFGSKAFAVTENAGVFVTDTAANVWSTFNKGLTNMAIEKVFASKGFVYVICSTGNVYETNGTADWKLIQAGLPAGSEPVSLAFLGGKVYLAAHGQGAFVKPEGSGEWTDINKNLPTDHLTSITALGTNVYVSAHHGGVYVSDIHNIGWKATAETSIDHTEMLGLDGDAIQALGNYGGYVFASYKGGLLATSDEGKTWERGGNQFNLPSFTDVNKIGFAGERVFVTTENNCIYSNALSEVPLTVAFSEVKKATCDNKAGELTIAFTGGTAPYKIKWSTGETTLSVSNLSVGNYWVEITDKIGAVSKDSIQLFKEACANVSELELANTFQVYPNPAKSNFTINSTSVVNNIHIYNELGMLVKEIEKVNTTQFAVNTTFEKGVYFIYATSEDGTHVQKLIVE
ncbi:MAG: T9SS type A sorting domain-containing protein [Crocinitomicaceae bacterium]|nr:T9SS type A sorting domain-containing protein [Crocinitomicaceae bacterium]